MFSFCYPFDRLLKHMVGKVAPGFQDRFTKKHKNAYPFICRYMDISSISYTISICSMLHGYTSTPKCHI
ncbi:unnamed protein product [Arabidopsis lyrata]|nr:unnamed protein product [Arabidopsis lyrata]